MRPGGDAAVADDGTGVPRRGVPHATEAPTRRPDQRFQHGLDSITEGEVTKTHDARGDTGGTIPAAVAHGRDARHELCLAHRPHLLRSVRAIHGVALHE